MNKISFTNFLTVVVFAVTCGYGIGARAAAPTTPAATAPNASAPAAAAGLAAGAAGLQTLFADAEKSSSSGICLADRSREMDSADKEVKANAQVKFDTCMANIDKPSACRDLQKQVATAGKDFNSACGNAGINSTGDCSNAMGQCQQEADSASTEFGTASSSLNGLGSSDSSTLFGSALGQLSNFGTGGSSKSCGKLTATTAKELIKDLDDAQKELTDAQKSVAADQLKSKQDLRTAQSDMMGAQGKFDKEQGQQFADLKKNQADIQAALDKIDTDTNALNNQISAAQVAKGSIIAKQASDIATAGSSLTDASSCRNKVLDYLNQVTGGGKGFSLGSLNGADIKKNEIAVMQNCLQARILARDLINKNVAQQLAEQDAIISSAQLQIPKNAARRSQIASDNAAVLAQQTQLNKKGASMFLQSQLLDIQNYQDISKNVLTQQQNAAQDINRIQQKVNTYSAQITENGGMANVRKIASSNQDKTIQDVQSAWQTRHDDAQSFFDDCCDPATFDLAKTTFAKQCATQKTLLDNDNAISSGNVDSNSGH